MKILIIRLSSLGDIVHALPALAAVRAACPDAEIGWAVREDLRALLDGHPLLDRVHAAPRRWYAGRMLRGAARARARAFLASVREAGYELAIDLMGIFKGGLLAKLSGASRRWGPSPSREGARFFYTRRVPVDRGAHAVARYWAVVAPLFDGSPAADGAGAAGEPEFGFPDFTDARRGMAERLALAGLDGRRWVALHPGAGKEANRWPPEHWRALSRSLKARGLGVVATGSASESALACAVHADLNLAGALDLPRLASLLGMAGAVVAGDTGPLHLAAAQGVPTVSLYGAADPATTGPARPTGRVLIHHPPCGPCFAERCSLGTRACMRGIDPAAVAEAVDAVLGP